jgi:hypothetical protein
LPQNLNRSKYVGFEVVMIVTEGYNFLEEQRFGGTYIYESDLLMTYYNLVAVNLKGG